MSCFHPIQAWRDGTIGKSGKRGITFNRSRAVSRSLELPCGQCVGCRLERSRQWAIRCVHESQLYDCNCFVTLTYSDVNLPADSSLCVRDFQLFMKRLRKRFKDRKIRFFHCGEYGEKFSRPHYHACLFNFDFSDRVLLKVVNGYKVFTSQVLTELWPLGFSTIGDVTFESAAYVARYILKKITGDAAASYYQGRKPEYITMSRRPGIAAGWFVRFKSDVFPSDEVIVRGKSMRPPKFYEKLFEVEAPEELERIRSKRKVSSDFVFDLNGSYVKPERLEVREVVSKSRLKSFKRNLEVDDGD